MESILSLQTYATPVTQSAKGLTSAFSIKCAGQGQ